jgi:hypothetical protein
MDISVNRILTERFCKGGAAGATLTDVVRQLLNELGAFRARLHPKGEISEDVTVEGCGADYLILRLDGEKTRKIAHVSRIGWIELAPAAA